MNSDLKVRLVCEGIADQRFLRDFLQVHYATSITDKELKDGQSIVIMGGWEKLEKMKQTITEDWSEYKTLVFLDADNNDVENKPGCQATHEFVDKTMKEWEWENYATYAFPNNESDGAIEDLFENIINPDHKAIFDCWQRFEECLFKQDKAYTIPAKKSKIYSYHECLNKNNKKGKELCKDGNRNFQDPNLWYIEDLTNPYIAKLKTFFDKNLF